MQRVKILQQRGIIPSQVGGVEKKELTKEQILRSQREEEIKKSLNSYDFNKPEDLYETIGSIWGGNSIFYYDKDQAVQQLMRDAENSSAERPPEFMKQMWDKKWDSMDFTWFQQHKHLGPQEKKKDPTPKYHMYFLEYL